MRGYSSMKAYAFRSGEIGFGRKCPEDALVIISGPEKRIRKLISGAARLAYDNETYLVPGIPEAGNDNDKALDALLAFQKWLTPRLIKAAL